MRSLVRFKARGSEWSSGFLCCSSSKLEPTNSVAVYCCGKEICYEQPLPRASPRVRKNWLKPYPLSRRLRWNSTPAHAWLRTPYLRRLPFDSRRADLRNPALRELHRPPPLPGPPNVLNRAVFSLYQRDRVHDESYTIVPPHAC